LSPLNFTHSSQSPEELELLVSRNSARYKAVILSMNKDGSVKDTKSMALQEALVSAVFPFLRKGLVLVFAVAFAIVELAVLL
jgi:hypothetical protein